MSLTDKELQSLRNMGNECEEAADEIERLRVALVSMTRERDDYRLRFEEAHMAEMNKISGGRYPDGRPAW